MSWLCGKGIWLVLIGSLAFNAGMGTTFGVRAYNHHYGKPWGPPHQRRHQAFLDRFNLTPEQMVEVTEDGEKTHAEMIDLHQAMADESTALADLMVAVEPDREAIAAKLDKLAEMHREKQQQIVEHFLRFGELLNDEQREEFELAIRDVVVRFGAGRPGFGKMHSQHGRHGPRGGKRWHGRND